MLLLRISLFVALVTLAGASESYRILCVFPFESRSHFFMFEALCKGLAKKGHRVDMISHFPTKTPVANYKDIVDLSVSGRKIVNSMSIQDGKDIHSSVQYFIAVLFGNEVCELMGLEVMQKFLRNAQPHSYDLIITEFFGASCYIGLGHRLKAPVAVAMPSLDFPYVQEMLGSPVNNAFFSGIFTDNVVLETFWDRLKNTVTNFVNTRQFLYYSSRQTEIMRKYLGEDVPDVRELERNVSLALANTQHTFHGIRPITPAIVLVGGLHIEADEAQLSPELKKWMDEAKDGVVYFTLGSLINIETLPESTILALYASFKKIAPVKVLMKCADKSKLPPGIPSNLRTLPWLPQIPVLRHNNTRAFITHGGQSGSLEAIHYGVPMIGIPLFADQMKNVKIFVRKNMAVSMSIDGITEEAMDAALNAVLNDPKYKAAAKRESALHRDTIASPMNTAIFYVEYIIRNGPDSLRSPAVYLSWWQLHLIDIFAFLIACFVLGIYVLTFLTKIFLSSCCGVVGKLAHKEKTN